MHLKSLTLKNFRNFKNETLDLNKQYNFIKGRNGQGKTNLLEAIYYLSFLKSFRTSEKKDLVKIDPDSMTQVSASMVRQNLNHEVLISIDEASKRHIRLNGKQPRIYEDYYGLIPVLLFEPWDVYLFKETPSTRRKYINRALFLDEPGILKIQLNYDKVVAQKNRLLKEGMVSLSDVEVWNLKLAELGSQLLVARLDWIHRMEPCLNEEWVALTGQIKSLSFYYRCSFLSEASESVDWIGDQGQKIAEKAFLDALKQIWPAEKRRREALIGPHRDDWGLNLESKPIGSFGSQGENRLALIALKGAQLKLFEKEHQFAPIFLLDDVMSELDAKHAHNLIERLQERGGQVFLTTTDLSAIPWANSSIGATFIVEEGHLSVLPN